MKKCNHKQIGFYNDIADAYYCQQCNDFIMIDKERKMFWKKSKNKKEDNKEDNKNYCIECGKEFNHQKMSFSHPELCDKCSTPKIKGTKTDILSFRCNYNRIEY